MQNTSSVFLSWLCARRRLFRKRFFDDIPRFGIHERIYVKVEIVAVSHVSARIADDKNISSVFAIHLEAPPVLLNCVDMPATIALY